ncbi:hypothetical protein FSP39_014890 [Pinctada imbricata]|uniref:mannosyl-oligosaccharide 1,3-1,6-alpha-mannosidase n=1 Tax=Pinctada imbricata TaxID=66713 RepID=A0AA88XSA8_PINIB|nr:hypothetical protein FSP39_014890 [Pinctada imbricata]
MPEILNKVQYEKGRSYDYDRSADNSSYLDVIILPQSHNDPGWLMPFEAYYKNKTVNILDNTVKYLTMYSKMTMIWPEVIFLDRWWREASTDSRQTLKALIESGRLEIVSGGWVSPDEATSHYYTVLDQLIEGHQWLRKNIGVQPVNTWPLDQFGYSSSLPYIWKKAGMNNLGIMRVTQNVKSYFARHKIMNFRWRQPWDLNGDNDILCYVEPYRWFVTDVSCGPSTVICNSLLFHKKSERTTMPMLNRISENLVEQFKLKASLNKQKVIVVALGNDFAYDTVKEWRAQYNNVTALINYVNDRKSQFGVTMRFGTVKDYFNTIRHLQETDSYKTLSGDFFTYAEDDMGTEYWSGYFTTRAFDKRIGRTLMEHVRSAEILTAFALSRTDKGSDDEMVVSMLKELEYARQALALFQHHDAITGTSTHSTATDYRKRLHIALISCGRIMTHTIRKSFSQRHNSTT